MAQSNIDILYEKLAQIPITNKNKKEIEEIKKALDARDLKKVIEKIKKLNVEDDEENNETEKEETQNEQQLNKENENKEQQNEEKNGENKTTFTNTRNNKIESRYPKQLSLPELEETYVGLLLYNPKLITKFYIIFEQCAFEDDKILNLYKSVLFTEGSKYASEVAKRHFNFSKATHESNILKEELKKKVSLKKYDMEKIYVELRKLFLLRQNYERTPIKETQDKIMEITNYELYNQMSIEEVESAINQVNVTGKFKQAILNQNLTNFLEDGANNLTEGLQFPFPILSGVFKGMRKGETMAYAMPSNAGKSRFTINMAANVAFVHKKKVLIISNEMSEEKMKLCLITTILNNPEIQKLHGEKLEKTEGELLEFKFRPDSTKNVEIDEDGFVIKKENESQKQFVERLSRISTEFNKTIAITNWVNNEINNSIYFVNITDHTNEELQKVIINYYYKEKIEYIFYDTLKTDTANIGIGEELKKTTTILSNIAQNFEVFIFATLQLTESATLPINLTINDLAVSRTVKEVLDTLCLVKQINNDNLSDYEYSLKEVDTTFYDLKKYKNPDVRYYACVVDKNRAGAKPKVLFRLNLAYNRWEELGYLRLKQQKK